MYEKGKQVLSGVARVPLRPGVRNNLAPLSTNYRVWSEK